MRTLLAATVLTVLGCSHPEKPQENAPPVANLRIGAVMMETGHRLELAGEASQSGRWELAEYETHELEELFEEDLSRTLLPGDCNDQVAEQMFDELVREKLPALRTAAGARDEAQFAAAWREATARCNGCHGGCRVPFVQVPAEPGGPIPRLDPPEGAAPDGEPESEESGDAEAADDRNAIGAGTGSAEPAEQPAQSADAPPQTRGRTAP